MRLRVSEPKVPVGSAGWHLRGAGPGAGCAAFSVLALPHCCCVRAGAMAWAVGWRSLGVPRGTPVVCEAFVPCTRTPSAVLHTSRANLGRVVKYDMPAKQMISGKKCYKYKFLA